MIHQFRDKKKIQKRRKIIKTAIGFGVFLLLCAVGLLSWSRGLFTTIGIPIWKAHKAATEGAHNLGFLVRTKSSVFSENETLKNRNTELENAMLDYQMIKTQNNQLQELLGRFPPKHMFTLSNILAKPNRSPYDTLIIDAGSNQSIKEGERVFADANVPIGEISKTYPSTSLVMLYSNPGQTTEAMLEGPNASVQLVGRGGGNFEMSIPLELSSEKGALVVLPGASSEIVAIIEDIISIPTDPMKKVLLRSPVNIQNLKWVQVEKN